VGRRDPDCPLTGVWEAVRRPGDGQNSVAGRTEARRVGNGGGDECGEEGASSSPFYKGQGGVEASKWGGDRPAALVMAINGHPVWWGGKMEGEWGVKRGVLAVVLGGGGGGRSGFWGKKKGGRLIGWACLSVRGGDGPGWDRRAGREVGRGWAKNLKCANVQEIKPFRILFGIWIFGKLWKFVQRDLEGILTWGFFLKSSRLLKDFLKMKYAMPCYATLGQNLIRKDITLYDLFKSAT
jgi:hypothetical protein